MGKIVLSQTPTGRWVYKVYSPNGRIVVTSKPYASKVGAANGAWVLKKVMFDAKIEH